MTNTYKPTLREVLAGTDLSTAERKVLAACKTGEGALLGTEVPKESTDANRVRAALIRYLLLGGCEVHRPHPKGIEIIGAWIDDVLDFEGCKTGLSLKLNLCVLPNKLVFQDAELGGFFLSGSECRKGIEMQRAVVESSVHLNKGFRSAGRVDLGSARIGVHLNCQNGTFIERKKSRQKRAINCDSVVIGGSAQLSDGFRAIGTTVLRGAKIGGQLDCEDARFLQAGGEALNCNAVQVGSHVFLSKNFRAIGRVDFTGAALGGELHLYEATLRGPVSFQSATIASAFSFGRLRGDVASLDLSYAKVKVLSDDNAAWSKVRSFNVSGFLYDIVESEIRVSERLKLLSRKDDLSLKPALVDLFEDVGKKPLPWLLGENDRDFDPSPYTQFAKVLDAQGHRLGAAQVMCVRENMLQRAMWLRQLAKVDGSWKQARSVWLSDVRRIWDFLFRWLFGYGHQPARSLLWVSVILAFGTWLYGNAYASGQMAPNSDVVLTSDDWISAVDAGCRPVDWARDGRRNQNCIMPLHLWNGQAAGVEAAHSYKDYETFHAGLYALDLFVPLDALGQETSWAPSRDRGWWGWFGYAMRMPIQMAGWIIAAVGAAVLTGLVGRKD